MFRSLNKNVSTPNVIAHLRFSYEASTPASDSSGKPEVRRMRAAGLVTDSALCLCRCSSPTNSNTFLMARARLKRVPHNFFNKHALQNAR